MNDENKRCNYCNKKNSFQEETKMKEYNINYDGISFEDKIKLKIYYLYSLPNCKEKEVALNTLSWILDILEEEKAKGKGKVR